MAVKSAFPNVVGSNPSAHNNFLRLGFFYWWPFDKVIGLAQDIALHFDFYLHSSLLIGFFARSCKYLPTNTRLKSELKLKISPTCCNEVTKKLKVILWRLSHRRAKLEIAASWVDRFEAENGSAFGPEMFRFHRGGGFGSLVFGQR